MLCNSQSKDSNTCHLLGKWCEETIIFDYFNFVIMLTDFTAQTVWSEAVVVLHQLISHTAYCIFWR